MKRIIIVTVVILPLISMAQLGISWSEITTVNVDPILGFTRPRITAVNGNIPVVMWGKKDNLHVYTSRFNGTSFGSGIKINPNGITAFVTDWAGPEIGSYKDTVFVTFKAQPENKGKIFTVRSVDGATTYGDTVAVTDYNWTRFPYVAVAQGGMPYVSFMEFDSGFVDPHYAVATSNTGGQSYLNKVNGTLLAPGEVCDCCPSFIMADKDQATLIFRNNDNNLRDLWASHSTDQGQIFSKAADIDNNNWMIGSCPSSGAGAISNGDSLIAVWMSGASNSSRVNIATADFNSLTIGVNEELDPSVQSTANQNYPRIAGSGDTLGVVWQESFQGKIVVKSLFSVEGASGLLQATPDTVSDLTEIANRSPDIAYQNGVFHMTWENVLDKTILYRSATIDQFSGLFEVLNAPAEFKLYPNPTKGNFNVEIPQFENQAELKIIDFFGKTVYSKVLNKKVTYITDFGFSSGIFIVQINYDGKISRQKLQRF